MRTAAAGIGAAFLPDAVAGENAIPKPLAAPGKPAGTPTLWVGAVTPVSAVVKTRLPPSARARLLVLAPGSAPVALEQEPMADAAGGVREFRPGGLLPSTQYTCTLEVNGRPATYPPAEFRTYPPEGRAASFGFAFSSCARTGSAHRVFDTIRRKRPAFFLHAGDMHYGNISRNDVRLFRAAWDTVLASETQGPLYRTVPLVYVWDDHDFGPNDSDARSPARPAARRAYREYAPHYPLPAGDGDAAIYQAFSVGRARFIVTDLRSERSAKTLADGPEKTVMGATQKRWFLGELAAAARSHAVVFWVSSMPWIGKTRQGDGWQSYAHERREISNFIAEKDIRNLVILCGDAHMLAADDGANSDYSDARELKIPVLHGSALDQAASFKGGPYSNGHYPPRRGEGCFGWVEVRDDGSHVEVEFTGRNDADAVKVRLKTVI